ncbi:MAG TPA: site-specific DNA-methyltransferase [Pyrinomonadaceae bacterium]|jgi:DNA modification methylase|nr:site-specific DNA-methyltransferase [Pyrinomonadaceae bacterium]
MNAAPDKAINMLHHGDCLKVLPMMPDACVDLIVTSPPYADSRKETYGGIHPDAYVEWFLPVGAELRRVLKDDGSFVLNIKERVVGGERHTYVLELILALRRQGWLWTEEYIWHKKNCSPGKWPNRFRDAWERCLHFTKQKKFKMYQEEVMVPTGDWAKNRLKKLGANDVVRFNSQVGSGFGKNIAD